MERLYLYYLEKQWLSWECLLSSSWLLCFGATAQGIPGSEIQLTTCRNVQNTVNYPGEMDNSKEQLKHYPEVQV